MTAAAAYFHRDFRVAWSYRFSFFVQNVSMIFSLVTLRLIADLFGSQQVDALAPYGGDYFSFVLLGVGLSFLAYPVLQSFPDAVRGAQTTGTLEAMLLTRTSPALIIACGGLYPILIAVLQLITFVSIGALVLGAQVELANLGLVFLVLALTMATLAGIGLFSAAFVIVFKQKDHFSTGFLAIAFLMSGVMYPTSVLPGWIEPLAPLIPITHTLELARQLLLESADGSSIAFHFAALGAFSLLLPIGLAVLAYAVRVAKRAGSLAQY